MGLNNLCLIYSIKYCGYYIVRESFEYISSQIRETAHHLLYMLPNEQKRNSPSFMLLDCPTQCISLYLLTSLMVRQCY